MKGRTAFWYFWYNLLGFFFRGGICILRLSLGVANANLLITLSSWIESLRDTFLVAIVSGEFFLQLMKRSLLNCCKRVFTVLCFLQLKSWLNWCVPLLYLPLLPPSSPSCSLCSFLSHPLYHIFHCMKLHCREIQFIQFYQLYSAKYREWMYWVKDLYLTLSIVSLLIVSTYNLVSACICWMHPVFLYHEWIH